MDREYLKHIDSSPYVDEGFFDTAKASAAGLGQRVKNVLPSEDPYTTPLNAKLLSHYQTFINELKGILGEFSFGTSSPAERLKKSQLSPEQKETIDSLTSLYQLLVPSVFPAGTRPEIRGAAVYNPPNVSLTKSMRHLAREAWIGRATSRSGGEVDNIINKYINEIKSIYSKFIKNITKYFPKTLPTKISDTFKATLNDPKISKTLGRIEDVVKTSDVTELPPELPAELPPVLPAKARPATAHEKERIEKDKANELATIVAATLNIISSRVIEDKNSRPYYSKPLADGNYYLPKSSEEPYPLKHSSEWNPPRLPHEPENFASLSDTDPAKQRYLKDKEEYEKRLKSYRYVPIKNEKGEIVSYTYKLVTPGNIKDVPSPTPIPPTIPEPDITTEAREETTSVDEPPVSPDIEAGGDEDEDVPEDLEMTGEFLYDFASLYRKYHGKYSIEVTKSPVKIVFEGGREIIIRVYWNWNEHLNTILIQILKDGKSWETSELLKFYDDEVNPQSPYYDSNFNIPHFLEQVNPNAKALFFKIDKDKEEEVQAAIKVFKPAAYAVIRRKGPMEFKSYKSLRFYVPPEWEGSDKSSPHYGSVKLLRGKFGKYPRGSIISFKTIHDYYYSKKNEDSQVKFEDALNDAGYWDAYIDIKHEFSAPAPTEDSEEEDEAPVEPTPPIEKPKTPTPSSPSTPSIEKDWTKIPNAVDAVAALKTLKIPIGVSKPLIQKVVDLLGSDKSVEEYVKAVLKSVPPSGDSKSEKSSPPDVSEGIINPYQLINFL